MNKTQLINEIAKSNGLTQKESKALFDATFGTLSTILTSQASFTMRNFGTFKVRFLKKRRFFNPAIAKLMMRPAKLAIAFKSSPALSDRVNNKMGQA